MGLEGDDKLTDRGVPFAFVTGCDADVIPEKAAVVRRLQKSAQFRAIAEAVAKIQTAAYPAIRA